MDILQIIDTNSIILQDDLSEYMCIFDSKILETKSEQWRFNRILNTEKIKCISDTIKDKLILDTVLHFFYINDNGNERLICFDGNHRREALILLYKKCGINIKVCCYIYKCKSDNIDNIDNEIIKKFNIINQMTPIPDIYLDIINNLDSDEYVYRKNIIESVFEIYKSKYKAFYSINSKCRRPNFNETIFKDFCNNITFNTQKELIKGLEHSNLINKTRQGKVSKNIIAKCETQDFYLFI